MDNVKAYEIGQKHREIRKTYKSDICFYEDLVDGYLDCENLSISAYDDPVQYAFYAAGFEGAEMPYIAKGYRIGSAPVSGISVNHRDDFAETGVSMAHVEGFDKCRSFAAMGNNRHYYQGFVVTHKRGSDDEVLMVGLQKIKQIKIA